MSGVWPLVGHWLVAMMVGLAFVRWPGRVGGLVVALVLWPVVGPWASWLALSLVGVGLLVSRWRGRRPGSLVTDGRVRAVVLGVAVLALAAKEVATLAVAVAVAGLVWWLARIAWPAPRELGTDLVEVGERVPQPSRPAGLWGMAERVVRCVPCVLCGAVLETEAPVTGDPLWSVARATCRGCGVRLVGVVDTTPGSSGGVLWFPLPARGQGEGRQAS